MSAENDVKTESLAPDAGSVLPSQRMSGKTGYGKGGDPDDVFLSMEYDRRGNNGLASRLG